MRWHLVDTGAFFAGGLERGGGMSIVCHTGDGDSCLYCSCGGDRPASLSGYAQIFPWVRRDTGFLVFSFPRSLGSGVYDEINGEQRKLVRTYLNYISTKFRPIWMRFGARVSKTPCQTLYPCVSVLGRCFAYACTKSHPNRSKFGGDIAQINAHRFLLSPINFIINSTSQRPWEQKGQKTRVTPYVWGVTSHLSS